MIEQTRAVSLLAKILVVDDSPVEIKIIRRFLDEEYEVLEAYTGSEAILLAKEKKPDLILLDILMPTMNGIAVCKALKSEPATKNIPVIFITAITEAREVVRGFESGGQDYITKPFYSPELCARVKAHLDLKQSQEKLLEYAYELEMKNQQLQKLTDKLERTAMTDFLTGLPNRRSMTRALTKRLNQLYKKQSAVVILADIDNFKQVNDTYGHDCGDEMIREVSQTMQSVVGQEGVIARWGGEEFLVLLYNAKLQHGQLMAEKVRQEIEKTVFRYKDSALFLTLTLGVAELDGMVGVDASIKKADQALYKGKNTAKNCVVSIT